VCQAQTRNCTQVKQKEEKKEERKKTAKKEN